MIMKDSCPERWVQRYPLQGHRFFLLIFQAIGKHGFTKSTSRSDEFGRSLKQFFSPLDVDVFLTRFGLFKHLGPPTPQHKELFLQRFLISITLASSFLISALGVSYIPIGSVEIARDRER